MEEIVASPPNPASMICTFFGTLSISEERQVYVFGQNTNENLDFTLSVFEVPPYLESFLKFFDYLPFEEEPSISEPLAADEQQSMNPLVDREKYIPSSPSSPSSPPPQQTFSAPILIEDDSYDEEVLKPPTPTSTSHSPPLETSYALPHPRRALPPAHLFLPIMDETLSDILQLLEAFQVQDTADKALMQEQLAGIVNL